ncbi:MAG: ATP-dependent helicase RecG [Ignavibacteria bacterium]|nr:ATP-dependent helicase RecG [Ignavibacteria bacterium]
MPDAKITKEISPLQFTKGIGPHRAEAFAAEGLLTLRDFIYYFPRSYIDRNTASSIRELTMSLQKDDLFTSDSKPENIKFYSEITILANITLKNVRQLGGKRKMLSLTLNDGSGAIAKVVFWNRSEYFDKVYKEGDFVAVSGRPEFDYGKVVFNHPDIEVIESEDEKLYREGAILPKYRITDKMKSAGISKKLMSSVVAKAFEELETEIMETLPEFIIKKFELPSAKSAISQLHFPQNPHEIERAKYRIKFEELFYFQLFIGLRYKGMKIKEAGIKLPNRSSLARKLFDTLPFKLTGDQKKVLKEIDEDFNSGSPMNRLLQGDVGSGKTIVAILTILMAIDNGLQTAFMAPTELLAEQHYKNLKNYLEPLGLHITQLVGAQRVKVRRQALEDIQSGKTNVIVGTHAMFQSEIEYNMLGYVIIDEQHRFGVAQRAELRKLASNSLGDGSSPHVLVMTATPIPRTLSMTVYGDLDVSIIREMPANRKPIRTVITFESQLPSVHDFIKSQIQLGRQAFIVYPLVEKSEKLELKAATEHFETLRTEIFPSIPCGLLHGQLFWYEKDETMLKFLNKEFSILVATTVIEVGIDIPNATVMLIENAERFGLSQLHQLRGRVGRGSEQSYCYLATKDKFQYPLKNKSIAQEDRKAVFVRLKTMEETTDGFKISEIDLKLRGPGDILGTRQAGLPEFKYADLVTDGDIITAARREVFSIIDADPHLRKPENEIIKLNYKKTYGSGDNYFDVA